MEYLNRPLFLTTTTTKIKLTVTFVNIYNSLFFEKQEKLLRNSVTKKNTTTTIDRYIYLSNLYSSLFY